MDYSVGDYSVGDYSAGGYFAGDCSVEGSGLEGYLAVPGWVEDSRGLEVVGYSEAGLRAVVLELVLVELD